LNILALDTSTSYSALAIQRADAAIFCATPDPSQKHGRSLLPAVRDLLAEAGLNVGDLDALAVGLGPGSYTGLRIGLTAAKTLAFAKGKRLVGLDSLEILARNAPADAVRVAVIADAQRTELFVAEFARDRPGGPLRRVAPTRIEPGDEWLRRLTPETYVLGPGIVRLGAAVPGSATIADPSLSRPQGQPLVALAGDVVASGRDDDPWFLEPVYLRKSAAEDQLDAKTVRDAGQGRVGGGKTGERSPD
jgi:tRNA threonylcarbamoyladenosine biosynthesis protein TsaB